MELQIAQGQRDGAQLSVAKMAGELTEEQRACEVATRSAEIFRTEVTDLRRQLDARSNALETSHRQLTLSEAARVRAERERDSLAEENARLSSQLAEAERRASDLQDDYDIGTEEARCAGAVECRDATAAENEARGVTFDFFDTFSEWLSFSARMFSALLSLPISRILFIFHALFVQHVFIRAVALFIYETFLLLPF